MNTISKSYYQLLREDNDIDRVNKILDSIKRTYTLSRNIIISKPEIQNNLKLYLSAAFLLFSDNFVIF